MYTRAGALHGPKYGFGTDERFQKVTRQLNDAAELPGPGTYESDTKSTGTQRSSKQMSQPAYGFGTSSDSFS